ncbi:MAG: crotonase/enoyl-CoA hydratase family protein, partial [Comamonas sp.]
MNDNQILWELAGDEQQIAIIRINRVAKRNAISDSIVLGLKRIFEELPKSVRAAVLDGVGPHFCAGLDLSELTERDVVGGVHHSRMWHAALESIQYGSVPVIAALHGAVIGGGLELASACHIRVADNTTFFALPEGSRGIFVGGGGSVRIPRLIGAARMADMMFTGRVYQAADGERIGLAQYLVAEGEALNKAIELALRVAQNAPMTNYALMHAL